MTTLQGWAIPIQQEGPLSWADHTYVVSSDGRRWGCWGGSDGGHKICEGEGSADTADCLSQPFGVAEIVYAVTGVCHQTANRILRALRQTVSGAQLYPASWALYGAYGSGGVAGMLAWKQHECSCGISFWDPDPFYAQKEGEGATPAKRDPYFEDLRVAYRTMADALGTKDASPAEAAAEVRKAELEALVRNRIAGGLASAKIDSLDRSRTDMLLEMQAAVPAGFALRGTNSVVDVAHRANDLLNAFLTSAAGTLDAGEYKAFFGVAPGVQVIVADPKIAAASPAGQPAMAGVR